ncbi:MAG: hypothetical protein FWG64_00335 [Firmicutes bacterium]|nr:hypothetical protein [Bacillota bacterium]
MENTKNTANTQKLNPCKEINTADFARKEKFSCQCPRCGFLFNKIKKRGTNA